MVPHVELAAAAGLEVGNGVLADGRLCTSDPRVFAAGDVACAWHPLHDAPLRDPDVPLPVLALAQ